MLRFLILIFYLLSVIYKNYEGYDPNEYPQYRTEKRMKKPKMALANTNSLAKTFLFA